MPYNVLLIGLIVMAVKAKKTRIKWLGVTLFAGFYLFANPFFVAFFSGKWELPAADVQSTDSVYDYGVVLSGGMVSVCVPHARYYDLDHGSDRLLAGFMLYKKGVCRKLILTGTNQESLLARGKGEVQISKSLLVEWGVDPDDIVLETQARNTRENAVYSAELLGAGAKKSLLITSAYHMRRSKACFEKAGLQVDPFPVDPFTPVACIQANQILYPDPGAFAAFQRLWREWVGMLMYRLAGYC